MATSVLFGLLNFSTVHVIIHNLPCRSLAAVYSSPHVVLFSSAKNEYSILSSILAVLVESLGFVSHLMGHPRVKSDSRHYEWVPSGLESGCSCSWNSMEGNLSGVYWSMWV